MVIYQYVSPIITFLNDPDFANITPTILTQVLQTLFVCTGCDYTSLLSQIGKTTFLRCFFQYGTFITGRGSQGTLADIDLEGEIYNNGFLAFLRLIGKVYFERYSTGFGTPSPANHFLTFSHIHSTMQQQHNDWLEDIRQNIADRITFDNNMIPSNKALYYHWKRSCRVLHMWKQVDRNTMVL